MLNQRAAYVAVIKIHRAQIPATLYEAKNLAIWLGMLRFSLAGLRRLRQVGFVGLDRLAFATNRTKGAVFHGLANAVRHEPRRLVGHAKRAADLMRADAFLAGAQQKR